MIELFITFTNTLIPLNTNIITLLIKNAALYRKLYFEIESSIILSYNYECIDIEKKVHIIKHIPSINCNDKKFINYLYKNLEKSFDENITNKINELNTLLINLYDEINDNSTFSFVYNPEISLPKLFNATDVQFENYEHFDLLKNLLQYINLVNSISNIRIFILYSLLNFITIEEFDLLKKEVELMNIIIINIEMFTDNSIVDYVIDDDLCIY